MVRKGSPVRVRQRASQTAPHRGFLVFRATRVTPSCAREGVAGSSPVEGFPGNRLLFRRLSRGSALRPIVVSRSARVLSGRHSVANGLARLPDHVDRRGGGGGVEVLGQRLFVRSSPESRRGLLCHGTLRSDHGGSRQRGRAGESSVTPRGRSGSVRFATVQLHEANVAWRTPGGPLRNIRPRVAGSAAQRPVSASSKKAAMRRSYSHERGERRDVRSGSRGYRGHGRRGGRLRTE
jgi:hypothetical protein